MREIVASADQVARCGLYCGACAKFLSEKCPGCHENEKATWCKIRSCCIESGISSCADCAEFADARECTKFDNPMSKLFALFFRSDRAACIDQIRRLGLEGHAEAMAAGKLQSIKK
jgi:hypothetical protein